MIAGLPWYVPAAIVLVNVTFLAFWFVNLGPALRAAGVRRPRRALAWTAAALLAWLILQAALSLNGFYLDADAFPPRFLLGITPPLATVALLLIGRRSRAVLDQFPMTWLTYIHSVRFFVELVVYALFLHGMTPRLMTFLGRNPDIVIGMTAPLVGYLCFTRRVLSPKVALAWHAGGLLLLANVATLFIFSVPSPFKLFAVERPNIGFFYFPFIWAPTHGVPTVICAHCVAVRRLIGAMRASARGEPAATPRGDTPVRMY